VVNVADSGVVVNCRLCNEDDVDNAGSHNVIVEPEVVPVHSDDVGLLVADAPASGPEVVTFSGDGVVGSCVIDDENSDDLRDVTDDVTFEVVEGNFVSEVSWKPV